MAKENRRKCKHCGAVVNESDCRDHLFNKHDIFISRKERTHVLCEHFYFYTPKSERLATGYQPNAPESEFWEAGHKSIYYPPEWYHIRKPKIYYNALETNRRRH